MSSGKTGVRVMMIIIMMAVKTVGDDDDDDDGDDGERWINTSVITHRNVEDRADIDFEGLFLVDRSLKLRLVPK